MWDSLLDEDQRERLLIIGGALSAVAAVAVASWKIFVHFSEKKASSGLTEEKFEALLKKRDEKIRKELAASKQDSEQRALLEKQLTALELQRTHLEDSLKATQKVHADTIQLLDEKLSAQLPSDRIEQAKKAIA